MLFEQKKIEIDPGNPRKIIYYLDYDNPDEYYGMESVLELPLAPLQSYIPKKFEKVKYDLDMLKHEGRLLENLVQFSETSLKDIDDYRGETSTRKYWIYLPKAFVQNPETQYPLILFLDGSEYVHQIPSPLILDKMIDDQVLPPIIAVYLEYSNIYRGREYDCNKAFSHFLSDDFFKLLRSKHQLPITHNPRLITIAGSSMSGLAAFFASLMYPSIFGNVIAQSPSFESKEIKAFKKMIDFKIGNCTNCFFTMDIGSYETLPIELQFMDADKTLQAYSSLEANKEVFNHLSGHGIKTTLHQYTGGHSAICWRGTLSDRLKEIYDFRLKECILSNQHFKK
jgi:enterochelin esterase-like enzyme